MTTLIFGLGAFNPAFADEFVIEPGQEARARQLVGLDQPELCSGVQIRTVAIRSDHVRILIASAGVEINAQLRPLDDTRSGGIRTRTGVLVVEPTMPPCGVEALRQRLDSARQGLSWRRLSIERSPVAAAAEAATLRTRLSARLGQGNVDDSPEGSLLARTQVLRDRGELAASEDALWGLLCGVNPPPAGALSRWIAWSAPLPPPQPECVAWQTLSARAAGQLESHPMAPWSDEPGLLAEVAYIQAQAGRASLASALLTQALMSDREDAAASRLTETWGWSSTSTSTAHNQEQPRSWWVLMLVAFLLSCAWWLVGGARRRLDTVLLLAGVFGMWFTHTALLDQSAERAPERLELVDSWLALGRGSVCEVSAPASNDSLWQARVRCPDGSIAVAVTGGVSADGHSQTEHHTIHVIPLNTQTRGRVMESWLHGLRQDLLTLEANGQRLEGSSPQDAAALAPPAPRDMLGRIMSRQPFEREQLRLVGGLAPIALVSLVLLLLHALSSLHASIRPRWLWLLVLALTVVAHLLAPPRMVMVYAGYMQTDQLIEWNPLRYGAGANWLYGPWLMWLGEDHATVQSANRLYGVLGTLFLAAFAVALRPRSKALGLLTLTLIGLSPLMWRDHASESILVGGWCLLSAALYGLAVAMRGEVSRAVLAIPVGLIAVMTRPEYGLALVTVLTGLFLAWRPPWRSRQWGAAALGVLSLGLVGWVHETFIAARLDMLTSTGALPGYDGLWARALNDFLGFGGLSVVVDYGPAFVVLPLFLAFVFPSTRWLALGLCALAFAWMALTRVDLPPVSIPRVHAPPWTLLALCGALGLDALFKRLQAFERPRMTQATFALCLIGWGVSAYASYTTLYAPTNADQEERLLRTTQDLLPDAVRCIATLAPDDAPPPGKTHRFFPAYLFHTPEAQLQLFSLAGYHHDEQHCPQGAYALLGMRCFMALREDATAGPPPKGSAMVEGCDAFLRRWRLESVAAWSAMNQGDVSFPMYPSGEDLQVGLYRILGPAAP